MLEEYMAEARSQKYMAEAGNVGAGNLSDISRSRMLFSELLHKFSQCQEGMQTHFNRFLLCQPIG
jgi:hypothetical protein